MNRKSRKLVSLVLPCYNEAESLPLLVAELKSVLMTLEDRYRFEVIFVDDGSTDQTSKVLKKLSPILPHHSLTFTRNFGHQAALLAGLRKSTGQVVITLDSDLQHPPSLIPKMLKAFEQGSEIVFTHRQDDVSLSIFKKSSSAVFYTILNFLSDTRIQTAGSDFRLMSRAAVDALLSLPENRIFLRGMVSWIGYHSTTLSFVCPPRLKGQSKYNLYKMFKLAIFGIASFSTSPLYLSALMGVLFSIATFLYGAYVLYIRFIAGGAVAGWSSVIFVLLGMGSILSFLLAIVGVYLAAIYDEVKRRPIYIIKSGQS